jgi:hypothetical protein
VRAITGGWHDRRIANRSPVMRMHTDGIVAPGADPAPGTASVASMAPTPAAAMISPARICRSSIVVATIAQNGISVDAVRSR